MDLRLPKNTLSRHMFRHVLNGAQAQAARACASEAVVAFYRGGAHEDGV